MLISRKIGLLLLGVALLVTPSLALAGDGVTVIFKSGQIVFMKSGYQKILDSVRGSRMKTDKNEFLELTANGGTFLLSLDEIAVVCREDCRKLVISHQQDPARGRSR